MEEVLVPSGLEGVVVATTAISDVDGEIGALSYRGHAIQEVVGTYHWEQVLPFLSGSKEGEASPISFAGGTVTEEDPMKRFAMLALAGDYQAGKPFDYVRGLPLALAATRPGATDPERGIIK